MTGRIDLSSCSSFVHSFEILREDMEVHLSSDTILTY